MTGAQTRTYHRQGAFRLSNSNGEILTVKELGRPSDAVVVIPSAFVPPQC
jgi:hypothetical protein